MATSSQDRRPRGTESRTNPAVIPGLIALVLIVAAVVVAVMNKKDKPVVAQTNTEHNPFADMPPEVAPPPKEHKAGSNLPPAPDSVLTDPNWISAKAIADEARVLYEAAANAKAKGDTQLATEKGVAARKKFESAFEMTADWEETLMTTYNEYDRKVVAIHDERSDWSKKMLWLKKSVGH